ncbi:MAG: CrcB family protein [Saprospirales bacterium]|nr:CrcB family protein [Saprospirales bacterium]
MLKSLIIIGTGGFLGSIARYLTAIYVARQCTTLFPYGTLIANALGCFLIGIFYALAEKACTFSPELADLSDHRILRRLHYLLLLFL